VEIAKIRRENPNRIKAVVSGLTHHVNQFFTLMLFGIFIVNSYGYCSDFQPDLKVGINGRTYPIGAQIVGNLGVSYPLWGDTGAWKYGYVRGGINLMTSGVVNRAGLELQVFPISILGISAGYDTGVRNFIPKWLDCDRYECVGRVDRKNVRVNLVAAYSGFSFGFLARYEEFKSFASSSKLVYDETTLLVGQHSGENVFTMNPVVLYQVADRMSVGFMSLYSHAIDTGGSSNLYGPVMTYAPEPKLNILAGVGLDASPIVNSAISGFFVLQYNIKPSMSVMDLALRKTENSSEK